VVVRDFPSSGWILDVGGGGEGVIGRLKGDRVVSVDLSESELHDAPVGPLKMVMDARSMQFLDESFAVVTMFFTLMYLDPGDHLRALSEAHRVLKPRGTLLIWDATIPPRRPPDPELFIVKILVELPGATVRTGYGVRWTECGQDAERFCALARDIGFRLRGRSEDQGLFHLAFEKSE
jgi:SAM-dependent methyltransferase